MGLVINADTISLAIPWAAGAGICAWIFLEVLKDYRRTKGKVEALAKEKVDKAECDRRIEEEKEARIREREAVRSDRGERRKED